MEFLRVVLPRARAAMKRYIHDKHGYERRLALTYFGGDGVDSMLDQSVGCDWESVESAIRGILSKHFETADRVQWSDYAHQGYGHEATSDPTQMCMRHPPLIWCNAMLPGDRRLNALERIVLWTGIDLGKSDNNGNFSRRWHRLYKVLTRGRHGDYGGRSQRLVQIHALRMNKAEWYNGRIVPHHLILLPRDYYGKGHPLAGWSKYGKRNCLRKWYCCGYQINAGRFGCMKCQRRRPYPDVDPAVLWSEDYVRKHYQRSAAH
jgi:hypothetical protein